MPCISYTQLTLAQGGLLMLHVSLLITHMEDMKAMPGAMQLI